jgi:hypothetical protein
MPACYITLPSAFGVFSAESLPDFSLQRACFIRGFGPSNFSRRQLPVAPDYSESRRANPKIPRGTSNHLHTRPDSARNLLRIPMPRSPGRTRDTAWMDQYVRANCQAPGHREGRAGCGQRTGAQSLPDPHPVPPGNQGERRAGRLPGRTGDEARPARVRGYRDIASRQGDLQKRVLLTRSPS